MEKAKETTQEEIEAHEGSLDFLKSFYWMEFS